MGARKIVNEDEVIRWFEQGLTYEEMSQRYLDKYHIETVPSLWGNFRRRRGLPKRIVRDDQLIPWNVRQEHRWRYPVAMLRVEARKRAGYELDADDETRLTNWHSFLTDNNVVVYYDPDLPDGFVYVPREPQDDDIIRRPAVATTLRHSRD
ncbi:MAG TPA: hypothetical protein VHO01_16425 [Jatrophihabitans sp.]|nr:hypothetical protein [Jatrophihabitans sp.]